MVLIFSFTVLSSSSSGNCSLLSDKDTHILIDVGISYQAIKKNLPISVEQLNAIVLTHTHNDHIRGLSTLQKNHKIPIYVSKEHLQYLPISNSDFLKPFALGNGFKIANIAILTCRLPHDCPGNHSVGYIFANSKERFGYATDLGAIPTSFKKALTTCNHVAIEANYELELLLKSDYPDFVKKRVHGEFGHLSNDVTCKTLVDVAKMGVMQNVVLLHLSETQNDELLAFIRFHKVLERFGTKIKIAKPKKPVKGF